MGSSRTGRDSGTGGEPVPFLGVTVHHFGARFSSGVAENDSLVSAGGRGNGTLAS